MKLENSKIYKHIFNIMKNDINDNEPENIVCEYFSTNEYVENWPYIDEYDNITLEDHSEDSEQVDCENFEILDVEDDSMTIFCGGDWQTPVTITVKLDGKKITVDTATIE